MASILDMLQQHLGGGVTDDISRTLGANRSTVATAMSAALPLLIGALARNTSSPTGADELHQTIAKNHDGHLLDDPPTAVQQPQHQSEGFQILQHLLGRGQDRVQRGLSQTTGLDVSKAGGLLAMLAPFVMAALGRVQHQNNLDPQSLHDTLRQEKEDIQSRAPGVMGRLETLLDADHDGDVDLNDLKQRGLGALGGLFGG